MQRCNQRLFRVARAVMRNESEAEDVLQEAYARAFAAIGAFEGRSSLGTWLMRIVINEALGRARAAKRRRAHLDGGGVAVMDLYRDRLMRGSTSETQPDGAFARAEVKRMLEEAIARLPDGFRMVFVLREIEELSVEETAEAIGIAPATVKTRHHRARRRLREELAPELRTALTGTFPFAGADCEAMTERVVRAFC
jgi:RNA polymerase sigma-70 factor (ECF subfamily)